MTEKINLARQKQLENFLNDLKIKPLKIEPLAHDASFRRYERLILENVSYIIMDAPPPKEDVRPFIAIANHLKENGFSPPTVINFNIEDGFLLLEDLGDNTFNQKFKLTTKDEQKIYESAVDCLIEIQTIPIKTKLKISETENYKMAKYDTKELLDEMFLLVDWYLPEFIKNKKLDHKTSLKNLMTKPFNELTLLVDTFVFRDFHADNLMYLEERKGLAQIGLLDFQDALIGHKAYDLVSLLEDARRDVSPNLEDAMIQRFLTGHKQKGLALDEEKFRRHYHILGAQRNAKIIGIFTRLWHRDKKPQFLHLIPRVIKLFERNLKHPSLANLKIWFDETLPAHRRVRPDEHA